MTRAEGERTRAEHVIQRLRAVLDGVEIGLRDTTTPIGNEGGQAVAHTAMELTVVLAKLDAYQRAESDRAPSDLYYKGLKSNECVTCGYSPCMCDQQ